jgi:hypothetical protein
VTPSEKVQDATFLEKSEAWQHFLRFGAFAACCSHKLTNASPEELYNVPPSQQN